MPNYYELPIGDHAPEVVNAVIEIPLGGVNKYEYDSQFGIFRLDRVLYSPLHYPGDYGFIPSTRADDGDALDVLVIVESASFTGCVMSVRPIGMLLMEDQGSHDQKILATALGNPRYQAVREYRELDSHLLRSIEHFFSIYKELEGKRTATLGWDNVAAARALITNSAARYKQWQKSA